MEFTRELACRLAAITYGQIPDAAVKAAIMSVADGVGVAIGGYSRKCSSIALRRIITGGPATLIGTFRKGHPADAAWYNGIAMHALDFDDVSATLIGHPTTVILPAALAAAEVERTSGKSMMRGYILGVEAACAVARLVNPIHYEMGWHGTGTIGTVGAAVAAGLVFGHDDETIAQDIGIAASMASGTRRNFGTMTKPLHAGNSARAGLTAARLGGDGFTADNGIIEANMGFVELYAPGVKPDYEKAVNRFANPFEFVKPGITIKRYPSCAATHAAVDAALSIMNENALKPGAIKSVEVGVKKTVQGILLYNEPQTPSEAKFSMQYCVAAALCRGRLGLEDFTEEAIAGADVRDMMKKIAVKPHGIKDTLEEDPPFRIATVKITLEDGKSFDKRVDDPKGSPSDPMTLPELLEKFEKVAAPLGPEAVQRAWEALQMIPDMQYIQELGEVLGNLKPA